MGNQNNNAAKKLEWGDHNPKLTDYNFIESNRKKINSQGESTTPGAEPIDLSKEEPGRNRKGVREGEHK